MKEKKDGRYFNFFSDANLLTAFEDVSYLLGKTKTRLMEEAMADSIFSYVQTAKDLSQIHLTLVPAFYKHSPCEIIRECSHKESRYVTIRSGKYGIIRVLKSEVDVNPKAIQASES